MISPSFFVNELINHNADFFTGVPDSLLKSFCAYISDNCDENKHIIAVNEGAAVALACGYHLAVNKISVIYMQNSGLGNAINPLLSLADKEVYSIPMVLIIGWRGQPGIKDEPQHIKQGKVTCSLLDTLGISYSILSGNEALVKKQIKRCFNNISKNNSPYAFVVCKDTFEPYIMQNKGFDNKAQMSREEAIEEIISLAPKNAVFFSTTGMISRELYEIREKNKDGHSKDFLTVGSMGHTSHIALSFALQKPKIPIICLDGDGALLMHMGALAQIGVKKPLNFTHIVLNNGVHDSVGGQPTILPYINVKSIAKAAGYNQVYVIKNKEDFRGIFNKVKQPVFAEAIVKKGSRKDLDRPKSCPIENKKLFMENAFTR
ncbi:MAG: phosphonopyruvate decarboxylase [Elusimicrobiota bacterium]|jgi:phosphonopyruvate decarboxylase|nr:phosphonopyruvate decarboxylase [Elusimicrobiota bacterium]